MSQCLAMKRRDWYFRDKSLPRGEGHGWSRHGHAVVTLVVQGALEEGFDRGLQQCHRFELHYKPPAEPHVTRACEKGVRMFLLGLRDPSLFGDFHPGSAPRVVAGGGRAARALGGMLALASGRENRAEASASQIAELLTCIKTNEVLRSPPTWLTELHERLCQERGRGAELADLARLYKVHPVYLARAFKRHYGRSIGALRRELRCDRAVRMLLTGDRPAGVAQDLGYADQSHFTREFRRETGWTPGRFSRTAGSLG
ncbi:MAG: AraC family transcriptional regulator [Xanthomonadales bacterium]|nr:AraC family transcriptional regulator [Xanthomonadales bacterium]